MKLTPNTPAFFRGQDALANQVFRGSDGLCLACFPVEENPRRPRQLLIDEAIERATRYCQLLLEIAFPLTFEEFPDYDLTTLPTIPDGFKETSWHNDAAPSFDDETHDLRLWIDYAEVEKREIPDASGKRFLLMRSSATEDLLCETDDFADILNALALYRLPA